MNQHHRKPWNNHSRTYFYIYFLHLFSLITMLGAATGHPNESQPSTSSSSTESSQPCRHFQFHEILLATDSFDESLVIGEGGFGKVYKGYITYGSTVVVAAIKRLDPTSSQGASEFWAEVEMLSNFRHPHLVSLFGYCNHEKEMILIYEYVPNGTLEDHLHKLGTPLSWLQRLKICLGAAHGLHYLHTGTGNDVGVIHRDVKSSNILLHKSCVAKISDFGLSKIVPTNQPLTYVNTHVKGTFGYLDPDYSFTGRLTRKSDVYAFGVILLEVICRKPALDLSLDEEKQNLARLAQESIDKGNLKHIIDSTIKDQISPKCLKEFVRIAGACLQNEQKERPTMAEVVSSLKYILTLHWKTNSSFQPSHRTLLGRMVDKFPFTSNIDNSGRRRRTSGILIVPRASTDSSGENFGRRRTISGILVVPPAPPASPEYYGKKLLVFPPAPPATPYYNAENLERSLAGEEDLAYWMSPPASPNSNGKNSGRRRTTSSILVVAPASLDSNGENSGISTL